MDIGSVATCQDKHEEEALDGMEEALRIHQQVIRRAVWMLQSHSAALPTCTTRKASFRRRLEGCKEARHMLETRLGDEHQDVAAMLGNIAIVHQHLCKCCNPSLFWVSISVGRAARINYHG